MFYINIYLQKKMRGVGEELACPAKEFKEGELMLGEGTVGIRYVSFDVRKIQKIILEGLFLFLHF